MADRWWESFAGNDEEDDILKDLTVPNCLKCPLTLDLMEDPVQTSDGFVFERRAIQAWFARGRMTSPMTNLRLTSLVLTPVPFMRQAIEDFLVAQPNLVRKALESRSVNSIAIGLERAVQDQEQYVAQLEDGYRAMSDEQRKAWRRLLYATADKGDAYVFKALGEAGALAALHLIATDVGLVRLAIGRGNAGVLKALAHLGAPLNEIRASDGSAPVHMAAHIGNVEAIEIFARFGADLSIPSPRTGVTALRVAVAHGHVAAATSLLQHGADVNSMDLHGSPPMHSAVRASVEMVETLVRYRAKANSSGRDWRGWTALHDAALASTGDLVDALLRAGAVAEHEDFYGRTPADVAMNFGHDALARRLDALGDDIHDWFVCDGLTEGIVVREKCSLTSACLPQRLAANSRVRQRGPLNGNRLQFVQLAGEGPSSGWVTIRTKTGGNLLWRARRRHAGASGAVLSHHCQQLLDYTSSDCLPPQMSQSATQWIKGIQKVALDTLVWQEANPSAEDGIIISRHCKLEKRLSDFLRQLNLPWAENPLMNATLPQYISQPDI